MYLDAWLTLVTDAFPSYSIPSTVHFFFYFLDVSLLLALVPSSLRAIGTAGLHSKPETAERESLPRRARTNVCLESCSATQYLEFRYIPVIAQRNTAYVPLSVQSPSRPLSFESTHFRFLFAHTSIKIFLLGSQLSKNLYHI